MIKRFISTALYMRRKMFYPKNAEVQRSRIFDAVANAGREGLTRDQIVVATGIPLQSVTWRVSELVKREKLEGTTFFRETRQGRFATVLVARGA